MTKPLTSVAAMMLYEQGRLALRQPIAEILPEFADARVYPRVGAQSGHRAGRADPGLAPAHPHLRHDVRLPAPAPDGRDAPADGRRVLPAGRLHPGRRRAAVGRRCRCCSSRARGWNYGVSTDVLGRVVEVVVRDAARPVLRRAHHRPARHGRHRVHRAGGEGRPVRRPVRHGKAGQTPIRKDDFTTDPRGRSRSSPAAAGWSPPRRTTCASPGCCWAGASWTGCGCSAAGRWTT